MNFFPISWTGAKNCISFCRSVQDLSAFWQKEHALYQGIDLIYKNKLTNTSLCKNCPSGSGRSFLILNKEMI